MAAITTPSADGGPTAAVRPKTIKTRVGRLVQVVLHRAIYVACLVYRTVQHRSLSSALWIMEFEGRKW